MYKIYLNNLHKILGSGITYDSDLDRIGKKLFGNKFAGVFPIDKVPQFKKNETLMIVNTDKSNESGEHWVGVGRDKDKILVYDSFGRSYKKILPLLKQKFKKYKIYNTDRDVEQKISEMDCGSRSISFLILFDTNGFNGAKFI